jgi:diacylglycerol O-acyltransferase
MARKRIAFVDYALLRADHPDNLMIITGLITFSDRLDYGRLKATVDEMTHHFPRFRQRPVPSLLPLARPFWEDDPAFNIEFHLERVTLPAPADQAVLQELISLLMSIDLDPSHPLWKFYVIEDYSPGTNPGGSALVLRLHHALADGIALLHVLLSMTEETSQAAAKDIRKAISIKGEPPPAASGWLREELIKELVEKGARLVTDPTYAWQAARFGVDFASVVGKLALRPSDPHTLFKGRLGNAKRAVWSQQFDLNDIKRIGQVFGCTVNDVLLSAMAGSLGRYIEQHGRSAEGLSIRGFIPVNQRLPDEASVAAMEQNLGNDFGVVHLDLPVGIDDPVERLRKLKGNMDALKSSQEPLATRVLFKLMGVVPDSVEKLAFAFFDTKGTTIMTNVPGPRKQIYMAGAPIEMLMAWVPQSGRIALGVSIISYNGRVWVGVATDQGLVPDPEQIIVLFGEEYAALSQQADAKTLVGSKDMQLALSELDQALKDLEEWLKL